MRNKFYFLHEDKHLICMKISFLQPDVVVYGGHIQAFPKYPKQQFWEIFAISQEKKEG